MPVKKPENVCINGSCLSWSVCPDADGYVVHNNDRFVEAVKTNKYEINAPGQWAVSNVFKDADGHDCHSEKTPAKTLAELSPTTTDVPAFILNNYRLVFQDNFDRGFLDDSKWDTKQPWSTDVITNNEDQFFVDWLGGSDELPNPFLIDNNVLSITATQSTPYEGNNFQPITSGVLSTHNTFRFTYGFVESRIRVPEAVNGLWAAFWLYSFGDEIDIMEIVGNEQYGNLQNVWQAYHHDEPLKSLDPNGYNGGQIEDCSGQTYDMNNGLALPEINPGEFNTYGLHWTENTLRWYVNGSEVNAVCGNVTSAEMYLIINLAFGGTLGGAWNNADLPASIDVDYVRVYQR